MLRFCLILITVLTGQIAFAQPDDIGQIYSIGINSRLSQLPRKMVFVADTTTENEFSMPTRFWAKRLFFSKDSSDIITIGNQDNNLKNIFDHYKKIRLISAEQKNRLFAKGVSDGWMNFYKRYTGYAGIVFLSPVYFNKQHTKAIFQLSLASGSCSKWKMVYE